MNTQLKSFIKHGTTIQFAKYVLMGVSNTLVDFFVYLSLTRLSLFFGTHIFVAKIISFFVATSWSYFGNKRWTFSNSNKKAPKQAWKYYIGACVCAVINVSIDYIAVKFIGLPDTIGIVIAAGGTVFVGFILNKWWVFAK